MKIGLILKEATIYRKILFLIREIVRLNYNVVQRQSVYLIFPSSTYLDESFRLQMFQEFSLLIRNGRRLLLLLLQSKFGLHRGNRFGGAGCTSLDPGRCKDEASEDHGHRHQRDSRDSSDLNRRTLWPHVCLTNE